MQMVGQDNLEERLMFYWSKMYISNIHRAQNYDVLKKCIVILIGNFELKNLESIAKGHTKWELREKDFSEIVLTEVCEIHIIELPKLKKLVKRRSIARRIRDMEQIFANSRRIGGNRNGK